jgi:hypothetical protein
MGFTVLFRFDVRGAVKKTGSATLPRPAHRSVRRNLRLRGYRVWDRGGVAT